MQKDETMTIPYDPYECAGVRPGSMRSAIYRVGDGYLLADDYRSFDAFESVCLLTSRLRGRRVTGVIGVPGDRNDAVIEHVGRAASRGFHRVIIKEHGAAAGRSRGEVAGLLYWTIKGAMPTMDCAIALDEREALRLAVREMMDDDVVIVFYNDFKGMQEVLAESGAVPVASIPELSLPDNG